MREINRLNGSTNKHRQKRIEHTDYREKFGRFRLSESVLKPFTQSCNIWLLSTTHSTDDG